jgi:hypothetical protein
MSDDEELPEMTKIYTHETIQYGNTKILRLIQDYKGTPRYIDLKIGDCIRFVRYVNKEETVSAKIIGFQISSSNITGIEYLTWKPEIKNYAKNTFPERVILLDEFSPLGDYTTITKINCPDVQESSSLVNGRIRTTINKKKIGGKKNKSRKRRKRNKRIQ